MILLQGHHSHRLGLVFLDLLGQRSGDGLDCAFAAHRGGCKTRFHACVVAGQALEAHADLLLPALLGAGRCIVNFWQRLADRNHLLAENLAVAPGDKAVDEREGVDGPG